MYLQLDQVHLACRTQKWNTQKFPGIHRNSQNSWTDLNVLAPDIKKVEKRDEGDELGDLDKLDDMDWANWTN